MTADEVLVAARRRAEALAAADPEALSALLHPDFTWAAHIGQRFDRAAYVARNTGGTTRWRSQHLREPVVVVVGRAAVLTAVVDDVVVVDGADTGFTMPVTLTWVHDDAHGWRCLAGHAGPHG